MAGAEGLTCLNQDRHLGLVFRGWDACTMNKKTAGLNRTQVSLTFFNPVTCRNVLEVQFGKFNPGCLLQGFF